MAATPPTTPPTIAPVLDEELEEEEEEPVVTGREEVKVWVAWVVMVATWPAPLVEL